MTDRRWLVAVLLIAPFGVLAWLAAQQSSVLTWLFFGGWAVLVVGMVLRGLRPNSRGHGVRTALAPAADGLETVQGIYLGRPDVGPVAYGPDDAPDVTLYVDTPDPDPGDLRQAGRGPRQVTTDG